MRYRAERELLGCQETARLPAWHAEDIVLLNSITDGCEDESEDGSSSKAGGERGPGANKAEIHESSISVPGHFSHDAHKQAASCRRPSRCVVKHASQL
jgi:hypothetical protein